MIGAYVRWVVATLVDGSVSKHSSWHIVTGYTRDGSYRTRCGRLAPASSSVSDSLPGHERSCEACLRYALGDRTDVEDEGVGE